MKLNEESSLVERTAKISYATESSASYYSNLVLETFLSAEEISF